MRAKGFKPEDFAELGYLGRGQTMGALNEQSVIIDERDEVDYEGEARKEKRKPNHAPTKDGR